MFCIRKSKYTFSAYNPSRSSPLILKVKLLDAQSCPTRHDRMDCSPPDSSVHGILPTRLLEWVAIPFSRGSSWPKDQTQVSYIEDRFFPIWAIREALLILEQQPKFSGSPGSWLLHLYNFTASGPPHCGQSLSSCPQGSFQELSLCGDALTPVSY